MNSEKLWPRSWKCCPRPALRASFSRPRSQFSTIRTSQPAMTYISLFLVQFRQERLWTGVSPCFSQIEAWCPVLPWRRDHDPFKPSVNFTEVCTTCQKYHYALNSLSLLTGQKRKINFLNQRLWHLAADYTIIMSSTLKNDHVMYDCSAWFLRIILSSSGTLCCFASAKRQKIVWPGLFEELVNKLNVVHRINRYQVDDGLFCEHLSTGKQFIRWIAISSLYTRGARWAVCH